MFGLFDGFASEVVNTGHQAAFSISGIFRNLSICRDRSPGHSGKMETISSLVLQVDKFAEYCQFNTAIGRSQVLETTQVEYNLLWHQDSMSHRAYLQILN